MHARTLRIALILCRPACVLALSGCGGDGSDGNGGASGTGGTAPTEDPRSMAEICATYCENARAHGCESDVTIAAPTCIESCDIPPPNDSGNCPVTWKNHSACLADVPNLCDAAIRDDYCLDAYCDMRDACDLPDPQCR